MKVIDVEGKKVKVQIWDTAGQDRFKTITESFYKNASGVVLTYAVNNRESFQNVENWMRQVKAKADEGIACILVGNKSDVEDRCVDFSEGKTLADSYGIKFYETSAKEAQNVNDVFFSLSKEIKDEVIKKENTAGQTAGAEPKTGIKIGKGKRTVTLNCC